MCNVPASILVLLDLKYFEFSEYLFVTHPYRLSFLD